MFLMVRWCAEHTTSYLDSRSQVKDMEFPLEFHICSIYTEPFGRFSLNFNQLFLYIETMCRTYDSATQTQGQGLTSRSYYQCISAPYPFDGFALSCTQMFLSVRHCAGYMTQLPRLKVTGQGNRIYPEFSIRSISPEPFG